MPPISLLELDKDSHDKKLVVCCPSQMAEVVGKPGGLRTAIFAFGYKASSTHHSEQI